MAYALVDTNRMGKQKKRNSGYNIQQRRIKMIIKSFPFRVLHAISIVVCTRVLFFYKSVASLIIIFFYLNVFFLLFIFSLFNFFPSSSMHTHISINIHNCICVALKTYFTFQIMRCGHIKRHAHSVHVYIVCVLHFLMI